MLHLLLCLAALCISTCFSLQSGKFLSQTELMPSSQLHCALTKGASMQAMGERKWCYYAHLLSAQLLLCSLSVSPPPPPAACYDSRNHCLWTCNSDWVDIWDCAGKIRVAIHHLASRLGKTDISELIPSLRANEDTIPVSEAITLMLRHIGMESCRLVPGSDFSTSVVHSLPLLFLKQCCDLLEYSICGKNWGNTQAIIITLQVCMSTVHREIHK